MMMHIETLFEVIEYVSFKLKTLDIIEKNVYKLRESLITSSNTYSGYLFNYTHPLYNSPLSCRAGAKTRKTA